MADPASEQPFTLPFLPKATHGLLPWGSQRPVSSLLDTHNPAIDAMDDMVERASATAENAQRGWRQQVLYHAGRVPACDRRDRGPDDRDPDGHQRLR